MNFPGMAKVQKRVALQVDRQEVILLLRWRLSDGRTGTYKKVTTRANFHAQYAEMPRSGTQECWDQYHGEFEDRLGPFHLIIEVGTGWSGTISWSWS